MWFWKHLTFIFLAAASVEVSSPCPAHADTLSVVFENDLFYRADRDYTNGVEINWAPAPGKTENFSSTVVRILPFFSEQGTVRTSYSFGQLMFTPEHTRLASPPINERPYAGFLYGAIAVTQTHAGRQDQWRLQLGMVGPSSLAADSQKLVHTIRGFDFPAGWSTQLRDEPGVILAYERTLSFVPFPKSWGNHLDFKPQFGGAFGNVFDYLNAGAITRVGFNMPPDAGPPVIEPSPPGSAFFEPQAGFGAYLFAGIEGRVVARNLFLDGNSFHASRSVQKNLLVGDFMFGAVAAFQSVQVSYVHMFRSAEYANQRDFDQFGRLSLAVNF